MSVPLEPLEEAEFDPRASHRRALELLAVLAVLHILAVWGYTSVFWGDHGRWLDEVERLTAGQVPYRDFQWHAPPLAIWVVGGLAKLASPELGAVSLITALLFLLVMLAYYRFVVAVAPGSATPALVAGFLFATAYANRFGPPLPLGSQTPAGMVGMLFLLVAAVETLDLVERPARRTALVAGGCGALAVLSFHAYWVSALYLWAAAAFMLLRRSDRPQGTRTTLALSFAVVLAAGAIAVVATAGTGALGFVLTGAGEAGASLAQALPSWERLTVEIAALSMVLLIGVAGLWLCLALSDAAAARWAGVMLAVFLSTCAVHLGMTVATGARLMADGPPAYPTAIEATLIPVVRSGRSVTRAALYVLDQRFQQHLFPALLPPLLLAALVWRWRQWADHATRDRLLLLLGLAVALRIRRGFAGADWYNVLVEIPTYALYLRLVAGSAVHEARRTVSAALGILVLVGAYAYYDQGRGLLTQRADFAVTLTERGAARWSNGEVRDYLAVRAVLDSLDPRHARPLFAFGQPGGWSYFYRRPSGTPVTAGLGYPDVHADQVIARLREADPPPLIVDNRQVWVPGASTRGFMNRWEPHPALTDAERVEQARFRRLVEGCPAHQVRPDSVLVVYDCGARPPGTPR